jgi:hypothetical protein
VEYLVEHIEQWKQETIQLAKLTAHEWLRASDVKGDVGRQKASWPSQEPQRQAMQ